MEEIQTPFSVVYELFTLILLTRAFSCPLGEGFVFQGEGCSRQAGQAFVAWSLLQYIQRQREKIHKTEGLN